GSRGWEHEDAQLPKPDGVLFFDKLSSVYLTGTMHDEHSPNHLKVANPDHCRDVCYEKYRSPCNHFCPAAVYEMVPEETGEKMRLQVNYTNCIHCKTCDIKCPADNITWTVPEGGGGPNYKET
ncbi:MAG: 4Fe-4S dicluster domain-containing protein, partial [Bdellovibrionaceae bacterium]|nr:4Fe-4S dicluster domain-containing protein [Pseudobdellovibrionaceae bacterium]